MPCHWDNCSSQIQISDTLLQVTLWDTAGQSDYVRLRPLSYPDTDIVFVCFSIVNRNSFKHAEDTWIPEVSACIKNVKILLVGLKRDLRSDQKFIEQYLKPKNMVPVTIQEGFEMAKRNACMGYYETSSINLENVVQLHECTF